MLSFQWARILLFRVQQNRKAYRVWRQHKTRNISGSMWVVTCKMPRSNLQNQNWEPRFLPLKASIFNSKFILAILGPCDITTEWKGSSSAAFFHYSKWKPRAAIQDKFRIKHFINSSLRSALSFCWNIQHFSCFVGSSKPEQSVLSFLLLPSERKHKKKNEVWKT